MSPRTSGLSSNQPSGRLSVHVLSQPMLAGFTVLQYEPASFMCRLDPLMLPFSGYRVILYPGWPPLMSTSPGAKWKRRLELSGTAPH
jgi:hypothetical protein